MKVLRACVLTAIVATTLSLGASVALLGEDNTVRETRDRHEIEALMWKYTRALDKGDGATYASTYTTDGQFGAGENATKGREALSKLVVRQPAAGEPPRRAAVSHGAEPLDRVRGQGPCPVSRVLPDGLRRDGSRHAAADRGGRPEPRHDGARQRQVAAEDAGRRGEDRPGASRSVRHNARRGDSMPHEPSRRRFLASLGGAGAMLAAGSWLDVIGYAQAAAVPRVR